MHTVKYFVCYLDRKHEERQQTFTRLEDAQKFAQACYESIPDETDGHMFAVHADSMEFVLERD